MKISGICKEALDSLSKYGEIELASKEDLKIILPKLYKFVYSIPDEEEVPLEVLLKVELWKKKYNL